MVSLSQSCKQIRYVGGMWFLAFAMECRVITNIWSRSPIYLKHVYMTFTLWSSWNHIPIKSRDLNKKSSHIRPIYLMCHRDTNNRILNTTSSIVSCLHQIINEMKLIIKSKKPKSLPIENHRPSFRQECKWLPFLMFKRAMFCTSVKSTSGWYHS